jgi:hypothetical protein
MMRSKTFENDHFEAIPITDPAPTMSPLRRIILTFRRLFFPFFDPVKIVRGLLAYPGYVHDWWRYSRLPKAETARLVDAFPCLHDRLKSTGIDVHYFYANGWAMRRILAQKPKDHLDVGSQTILANLLGAVVPLTFVDYRPLRAEINGVSCLAADILYLPFPDRSIQSLSCLHVAEHIGLGRYGDPLNPQGTQLACAELARVLAVGGNLYFALPVGRPRLCFNAHRIHLPETICRFLSELNLVEFSGVHDDGRYVEDVSLHEFANSEYACGFFWFRRGSRPNKK